MLLTLARLFVLARCYMTVMTAIKCDFNDSDDGITGPDVDLSGVIFIGMPSV